MSCEVIAALWNTVRVFNTLYAPKCVRRKGIFEWPGVVTASKGSQASLSCFQMKANGFSAAKLGLSVERPTASLASYA